MFLQDLFGNTINAFQSLATIAKVATIASSISLAGANSLHIPSLHDSQAHSLSQQTLSSIMTQQQFQLEHSSPLATASMDVEAVDYYVVEDLHEQEISSNNEILLAMNSEGAVSSPSAAFRQPAASSGSYRPPAGKRSSYRGNRSSPSQGRRYSRNQYSRNKINKPKHSNKQPANRGISTVPSDDFSSARPGKSPSPSKRSSKDSDDDDQDDDDQTKDTLDTGFAEAGVATIDFANDEFIYASALQSNGKIVLAGGLGSGKESDVLVMRLNSDGSLDTSFNSKGYVSLDIAGKEDVAADVAIQADGKIVIAGMSTDKQSDHLIARFHSDGTLDKSFNGSGYDTQSFGKNFDEATSVAVQADGKLVISGWAGQGNNQDFTALRYNSSGDLDKGFGSSGIAIIDITGKADQSNAMKLQADGKLILVGEGKNGSKIDSVIVRLNSDGSLDNSFASAGSLVWDLDGGNQESINDVLVRPSGEYVLVGQIGSGTNQDIVMAQLNSNGSIDSSFANAGVATFNPSDEEDAVYSSAISADGSVYLASNQLRGSQWGIHMLKVSKDGSLDSSFANSGIFTYSQAGGDLEIFSVQMQSDGMLVCSGTVTGRGTTDGISFRIKP